MERIINFIGSEYNNSKEIVQSMKSRELVTIPVPKYLSQEEAADDILKTIKTK